MMYHQKAIVARPAAVNTVGMEGCFVTIGADGAVTPADAATAAAAVYGLLNSCTDEVGGLVSVALPGCAGIHAALVAGDSAAVTDGARLVLADGGKVKVGTTGTVVCVACGTAAAGELVPVRIVEPRTVAEE